MATNRPKRNKKKRDKRRLERGLESALREVRRVRKALAKLERAGWQVNDAGEIVPILVTSVPTEGAT